MALIEQHFDQFTKWKEGAEVLHMEQLAVEKLPELLKQLKENFKDSGISMQYAFISKFLFD